MRGALVIMSARISPAIASLICGGTSLTRLRRVSAWPFPIPPPVRCLEPAGRRTCQQVPGPPLLPPGAARDARAASKTSIASTIR